LPKAGTPHVELIAVMAKYNPFGERGGLTKMAEIKQSKGAMDALNKLEDLGFNTNLLGSSNYDAKKIKEVGKDKIVKILEKLSNSEGGWRKRLLPFPKVYPSHKEWVEKIMNLDEEGLAKVLKKLSFLVQAKVYLFWRNPSYLHAANS